MAWALSIDPTSESSANTQFDLTTSPYDVMKDSVDWDDPNADLLLASSADTEGDLLVSAQPNNRQVKMDIKVTAATDAALDTAVAQLQQKIGKLCREGGTLKRTTTGGSSAVLDVIYAFVAPKDDWIYQHALTAVIPVRFTALPYWRGPEVASFLDNFSVDNLAANYGTTTYVPARFAVTGGLLTIVSGPAGDAFHYGGGLTTIPTFTDSQVTYKITTGAVISQDLRLKLCGIDGTNFLYARHSGGASIQLTKRDNGSAVSLPQTATGSATMSTGTSYWMRFRKEGNKLTTELWTAAPTASGSPVYSATTMLSGADAAKYGQGIAGSSGWIIQGCGLDYTFDDFAFDPYVYVEASNPVLATPAIYGIKGDVPALARLVVNEAASNDQWWAIWGNESRYFSKGLPTILDQLGLDTITSLAWAFDTGSGTLSVSGGLFVPSSTAEKILYRTDSSAYTDTRCVVKITTGASVASGSSGIQSRYTDLTNRGLLGAVNFAGASSNVQLIKRVAGVGTTLATSSAFTTTAATSYWLEFIVVGKSLTVSLYATDPSTGSSPITNATVSYTLTDAEYALISVGKCGLDLVPQATDYRWDDFRVQPRQGSTACLIGSEDLIVSGYSGTQTTRTGAWTKGTVTNHVVEGSLTNAFTALCATPPLGSVGNYRLFARLYRPTTNLGVVSVALDWGVGDLLRITRNDAVNLGSDFVNDRRGDWTLIDLGRVQIPPATKGTQQWQGRVVAKSTVGGDLLDIDYLALIPYAEGSGEGSAVWQYQSISSYSGRDGFDQTAGVLAGKTAPVGGTWAGAGDADDFSVETGGHTAQRTATSDAAGYANGRFEILGSATPTNTLVQVDLKSAQATNSGEQDLGVFARYTDVNNCLLAFIDQTTNAAAVMAVVKRVASVQTTLTAGPNLPFTAATFYTLRLVVDASGRWAVWYGLTGGAQVLAAVGQDSALATGGALASGKVGIFDHYDNAAALTRNYDNFAFAVPTLDAAVFAGKQMEFRSDSAVRQDSTGAIWSPESSYQGDYVRLVPAGREGRQDRIVIDTCRNDPDTMFDPSLSKTQLQVLHTPRYLSVPSS